LAKFYTISPQGVPENPHLFPMWRPTFVDRGHEFVDRIEKCDAVLFDLHTRIGKYNDDELDYIVYNRTPMATFCEWDRGGMSKEVWPQPLTDQMQLFFYRVEAIEQKRVHFGRLFDKTKPPPSNFYPYEKAIIHEEPMLSPDEIFNRPYDIVWIANTAPRRERLKQALEADGRLKCKIILGAQKIPFNEWINAHREGKMFVSCSGGGFTDERCQHLFSIAGIIRERTNQLLLHDLTDLVNCCRVSEEHIKFEIDAIVKVVNDKERLYSIYRNGYEFMKTYYTKEYIANNILETILKHI
jgi:hypothetical protein